MNGEVSRCVQGLACGACTPWVCLRDVTVTGNGDQSGSSGSARADRLRPAGSSLKPGNQRRERDGALIACLPGGLTGWLAAWMAACSASRSHIAHLFIITSLGVLELQKSIWAGVLGVKIDGIVSQVS